MKALILLIPILLLTGCNDEYEQARQACYKTYPHTVDYVECVKRVDEKQAQDDSDAALMSVIVVQAAVLPVISQ